MCDHGNCILKVTTLSTVNPPYIAAVPGRLIGSAVFLLLACSSIVTVEPAPYDVASAALALALFATGLRIPSLAVLPILLLMLFSATNLTSILLADRALPGYDLVEFARYTGITFYLILTYLLFLGLVSCYRLSALRVIWNGYTVAAVIAALAGIYGYHDLGPNAEALVRNDRAKGLFKDPNVFGPFLVPVLLHHIARIVDGSTVRGLRLVLAALLLYALLISFSRGAWANFVIAFVVFLPLLFSSYRSAVARARLLLLFFAGTILAALAVAYLSTTPALAEMFEKRANLVNPYDVGAQGRFDTQRKLLPDILSAPEGYGPNQVSPNTIQAPHNVYLKTYSEYGWVGGASWLAFSIVTIWFGMMEVWRRTAYQRDLLILFAATFAITIQGLTIDTLHWRHYFLILGILWALISLSRASAGNEQLDSAEKP